MRRWSNPVRRPTIHRLDYLKRSGNIFILKLKGPRNGGHYFRLTKEDMTRLIDEYLSIRGAPSRKERQASRQAAVAEMKENTDIGAPGILLISQFMGISIE